MTLSTQEAFRYCESLTRQHYENFPVGSLLIPKDRRPHVWAVYAFARTADDFADEGRHALETSEEITKRLALLDAWEEKLNRAENGIADDPIFIALTQTIKEIQLPTNLLRDLLTAYRMDIQKKRYNNFDEILNYCKFSANPVGRLVLHIMGYRDEELCTYSDHICTALQLANFWQDIFIDLEKDRIYLPQDLMTHHKISEQDLKEHHISDHFKNLLNDCIRLTAEQFNNGLPLCSKVERNLKIEMRLTWLGGTTILKKIIDARYDVYRNRPVISFQDKLKLLTRALLPFSLRPLSIPKLTTNSVLGIKKR